MATRGSLLRMARHLRGLTQKQSAQKLGVAQAVYSRMENNLLEVDDNVIGYASSVFDLPSIFFDIKDTVYGPPLSVHTMFRSHGRLTTRSVDMITAELNLRLMHLRRFSENVEFNHSLEIPRLDIERYNSPAEIADTIRRHWHIPSGPINNLTHLLERAGVVIGCSNFHGVEVSGVTFSAPGQLPLILLNSDHPADQVRFTLAHELGHLVMHRFPTPDMEQEANHFASELLFPSADLHVAMRGRKVNLALLAALKPEWKMSIQSILYAAEREGIVTKNQARYLWTQIRSKGWKIKEPASLDFEYDSPTVLPTIIKSMFDDLGFEKKEILRIAKVNEQEFDHLYPFPSDTPARPRLRIIN